MKEMDINIEGYNVNGICVGCLNYNRKMLYSNEVYECFKNLAEIDVTDGLSVQVCWECLAAVRNVNRFRNQLLQSFDILQDYSKKHTFLNSPQDLSQYATQNLTVSHQNPVSIEEVVNTDFDTVRGDCKDVVEVEVKTETDEKLEMNFEDLQDLKPELQDYNQDTQYADTAPDLSSEDDIQLSQLRTKRKEKKGKRKKIKKDEIPLDDKVAIAKRMRKLKNLPENIVELYTMGEDEMWQVRSHDRCNEEFIKIKYKCEECIIGFNTKKLMSDHWVGKHRRKTEESHQCDVCKAYLLTKENLSIHRSHHLTAFRCITCSFTTTLKRIMMIHVKKHINNEKFTCDTCNKVFGSKSKLNYHKNICHQEKPQCDCCGKVFANKMTLKYHLKILPTNKQEKQEKLYIPCKGCNKVFYSKKSYRAHVVIHDGVTYPCPICGKLFQWKRNLARHTRAHREREAGARHECRECGKTFASRDCLNNHKRLSKRHVPDSALSHECNYCGKKFATKYCMVDHIDWDHLKRIKYQCSVCFKAFKTSKIMVAHMNNIHEGKRNLEPEGDHLCDICGKSYKTVKRLKGHVWAMHTKRSAHKSYRCKYCPATFTWQTSIYKHVKVMHSKGPRSKQSSRTAPVAKKQEPYTMQYYPHLELQHDPMAPQHTIDIVHNMG